MRPRVDVIGKRFGRLVVLSEAPAGSNGRWRVNCLCDCGQQKTTEPRVLTRGRVESCGCLQREAVRLSTPLAHTTHGATGTPEYRAWSHMKGRCSNPRNRKYKDYGGRGVSVCDAWANDFEVFLRDMGPKPSPQHSIDRINVNGNYEPGNCRWATPIQQARNKRGNRLVELRGELVALSEACAATGVNYKTALSRLRAGKQWNTPDNPHQETKL